MSHPGRIVASPLEIPHCVLWLDASDAATLTVDGSANVSEWRDKSGNANHFTAAGVARPLYSAYQGNAIVSFDGATEAMVATNNIVDNVTGSTIVAVCRKRSAASGASKSVLTTQANALYLDAGAGNSWGGYSGGFKQAGEQPGTHMRVFSTRRGLSNTQGQFKVRADGVQKAQFTTGGNDSRATTDLTFTTQNADMDVLAVVVYQRSITDGELSQIEAYFNQKYRLYPTRRIESPLEIQGCAAWYDAAQGVTLSSDAVSQWDDQSGSGNHVSQATPAARPVMGTTPKGLPCVVFDGTDDILNCTVAIAQPQTVFIVGKWGGSGTGTMLCGGGNQMRYWRVDASSANVSGHSANLLLMAGITTDAWHVHSLVFNGVGSCGAVDENVRARGNGGVASATGIGIGGLTGFGAPHYATCSVAEALVFNRLLSDGERALVEQYLARKHGTYPRRQITVPTDLQGCALWLDATDVSSITKDGSNLVSQWSDKSGNALHAVQATDANKPLYNATGLNGFPCLDWLAGAAAARRLSTPALSLGAFTIFAVLQGSSTLGGYAFVHNADTTNGCYMLANVDASLRVIRTTISDRNIVSTFLVGRKLVAWRWGGLHALHLCRVNGGLPGHANRTAANTTSDAGTATVTGAFHVGNSNNANTPWKGLISEIIIFNRYLNDGEVGLVENYLAEKYVNAISIGSF